MSAWPIEEIRGLLEPTIAHMGYELYGLRQMGPGGRTLQIVIDRPDGVTIDDCERVSHVAGPLLDQANLIGGGRYNLEVSSPGAERPLRNRAEWERFAGHRVNVRHRVGESEGVIEGTLVSVDDTGVAVLSRALDEVRIAWEDVVAGRLAVAF